MQVACDKDEPQGDTARLSEFLKYMDFISSLSTQFGGSYFYDYHNMFSKKAEQLEAKGQVDFTGLVTHMVDLIAELIVAELLHVVEVDLHHLRPVTLGIDLLTGIEVGGTSTVIVTMIMRQLILT